MKWFSGWLIGFFVLSCYPNLESTEPAQKIYISSTDLKITDHGIYLYQISKGYSLIEAVFLMITAYILLKKKAIKLSTRALTSIDYGV